jgi:hypothetical protein
LLQIYAIHAYQEIKEIQMLPVILSERSEVRELINPNHKQQNRFLANARNDKKRGRMTKVACLK